MPKAAPKKDATMGNNTSSKQAEQQDGNKEFVVSKIVDHKVDEDGEHLYKVRWSGYTAADDTWEPVENLGNAGVMVHNYWISRQQSAAKGATKSKPEPQGAKSKGAGAGAGAAASTPKASGGVQKKKNATPKGRSTPGKGKSKHN